MVRDSKDTSFFKKVEEKVTKKKEIDPEQVKSQSVCGKCLQTFAPSDIVKVEKTGKKNSVNDKEVFIAQHVGCKDKPVSLYIEEGEKGFEEIGTTFVK